MYQRESYKPPERKENTVEALFRLTKEIASEVNMDAKKRYNTVHNLVDERGALSMDFFSRNSGGIYTGEEINNDKQTILNYEIEWSGAHDKGVQEFYKTKGIEGKENIAKTHKKEQEKSKASQMEMLTNAVLYKVLKERFLVVRTTTFDDYFSGIDNCLIDRETGDIVCAFDEVHDHARGDRKEKKWERVEAIGRGGKRLKYGVVPEDGKLIQREMRNIPVFFLSLTTEELSRGMDGFSRNLQDAPNSHEIGIYKKFVLLLQEEYDRVKDKEMPPATKRNLERFKRALDTMKVISDEHTKE